MPCATQAQPTRGFGCSCSPLTARCCPASSCAPLAAVDEYLVVGHPDGGASAETPRIQASGMGAPIPNSELVRAAGEVCVWPVAPPPAVATPGTQAAGQRTCTMPAAHTPAARIKCMSSPLQSLAQRKLTFAGYKEGVRYRFAASASNAAGYGGESIPRLPFKPPVTLPGAPAVVKAIKSSGAVIVEIAPPANSSNMGEQICLKHACITSAWRLFVCELRGLLGAAAQQQRLLLSSCAYPSLLAALNYTVAGYSEGNVVPLLQASGAGQPVAGSNNVRLCLTKLSVMHAPPAYSSRTSVPVRALMLQTTWPVLLPCRCSASSWFWGTRRTWSTFLPPRPSPKPGRALRARRGSASTSAVSTSGTAAVGAR